jgi:hypothetical protein
MSATPTKKTQQQKRKVWVSFLINILAVCFKDRMLVCAENCIWTLSAGAEVSSGCCSFMLE